MLTRRPALGGMFELPRLVDMRHTASFRLTAGLGAVFVVAMTVTVGLIYMLTADELSRRIDDMITHRAERFLNKAPVRMSALVRFEVDDTQGGTEFYAMYDGTGRQRRFGNVVLRQPFPIGRLFERQQQEAPGLPLRILVLRTSSGELLVVARDFTAVRDLRRRVLWIAGLSGMGGIIVALVAGIMLSIGPIRRIQRLQAQVARIAAGELGLRLPVSGQGDELDLISAIINGMVGEIERLLAQVKGATDAIAHDMRTPLTHLRARLDRMALHPAIAPDPALRGAMFGAIEELDAALARFRALLRISEIEASNRRAAMAPLDPMDVLTGVCELYEPLAEARGVTLAIAGGGTGYILHADETLLFEAISNLVENAIKFAPAAHSEAAPAAPAGRVTLSVMGRGDTIDIAVRDNGPGIPAYERERVLRRFERGAGAATAPGSGLGLSLVVAIVQLHGFRLRLEDAEPGLIAHIEGPAMVSGGVVSCGEVAG